MSRKYNGQHPERSRKRPRSFGRLEDVDTLRQRQANRDKATGSPVKVVAETHELEEAA